MRFKLSSKLYTIIFLVVLIGFTTFLVLDTFVIVRGYKVETDDPPKPSQQETTTAEPSQATKEDGETDAVETETTTEAPKVSITISEDYYENTHIHIADVYVTDVTDLRSAFAENTYGKNIKHRVRTIAEEHSAWLAINGDFYGARDLGYVIRNGRLYRNEKNSDTRQDLVIYYDGTWDIVNEGDVTAEELLEAGAWQVESFGPGLVKDGEIIAPEGARAELEMVSNPRTAIGMYEKNHYVFVVSDGRTENDAGLSVYQLAQYMKSLGCSIAYNLDGGGSSTMYFEGEVINYPTYDGTYEERRVSDILYIGIQE